MEEFKLPRFSTVLFYGLTATMILVGLLSFLSAIAWINKPFAGFFIFKSAHVASMGSRDWPGHVAGLKQMERIISADGQPLKEGRDLVDMSSEKPAGTSVKYVVESDKQSRTVVVQTTKFSIKDFFVVFLTPFTCGIIIFCLGFIGFVLKPNINSSWVFFIICLTLGIYMVTGVEMQTNYRFTHLNYFCIPVIPAALVHLCLIFPDKKRVLLRYPIVEYLIYIPAFLLIIGYQIYFLNFSDADSKAWVPDINIIYPVNRVFYLACVVCMIILLIHSMYKASSIIAKQRARMILFGVSVAFLPSVTIMLITSVIKVVFPWNLLTFFIVFFPASIAYSIVKHNLFEADTIIRRTVGYVVVTAIVVGGYVGVSLMLNLFVGKYQLAQSRAFPILFTLGVILIFNPLRDRIQALVNRIFFRKEYDYGSIVEKVSGAMTSLLDLPKILNRLIQTCMKDMFIDTGSVMLLSPDGTEYKIQLADGEWKQEIENKAFKRDDQLMKLIEAEKRELTKYDVLEDPKYKKISANCAANFEALYSTLIIPLVYQDKLIGSLNLGEKKSGKYYNREDIDLLRTLAHQGAVAIENARMVQEIIEKERFKTKIMDSFGKYVTQEVRDLIIEGSIPLDGETKDVTVLFADLRDFTSLAESTTPKEVVKIINGYFSEMAEAIGQNHGLVLQFIGDEIESVFGAPLALDEHPTHAVRAAMAMRQRLVLVNEKLQREGYGPLRHGIGIHTGNVVAANIGSEDRLSYALVGDTVNVASRIQGLNKVFGTDILISGTTVERMAEISNVEKLPAATVRGKKDPVEIFKLADD